MKTVREADGLERPSQKPHATAHGLSYTAEYRAWQTMVHRCTHTSSPAWANYGGRGIKVCDRWRDDPAAFLADMGPRPSPKHELDRINNNGHYEPSNCRWVLRSTNDRNRRSTIFVDYHGTRCRMIDLCEQHGVWPDVARRRIADGWTVERAVETPQRVRVDGRKRFDSSCIGET